MEVSVKSFFEAVSKLFETQSETPVRSGFQTRNDINWFDQELIVAVLGQISSIQTDSSIARADAELNQHGSIMLLQLSFRQNSSG